MGDNNRKRKRSRKHQSSETLDSSPPATTSTASFDQTDVGNIEHSEPPSSHRRHRRSRKSPDAPEANHEQQPRRSDTTAANGAAAGWESVLSARVLPAMDAVVKVFCVHTEPNFSLPWQRKRQYSSSSSGFVISGRRVLTNAHSVEHYTQVKLKKRGSDTKYLATVLAIGTECDIGIIYLYNL